MSENKTIQGQVIEAIKKQSKGEEVGVSTESIIRKTKNIGWNQVRDALYLICKYMTPIEMNDGVWCLDNAEGRGKYKLVFLGPSVMPKLQNQSLPVQQTTSFEKPEAQRISKPTMSKGFPDHCPSFKVPTGSTSLRLRRDFIEAAEERAKELWPEERISRTQLLNFLLWWFAKQESE
jgi:hypothetical protein